MKKVFAAVLISLLPHTAIAAPLCGFELNDSETLVVDDGAAYALDNAVSDTSSMSDDEVRSELDLRGIFLGGVSESAQVCLEEQNQGDFFLIIRILRCLGGKGIGC